jgi:RNA polymerase sigma factor (sigma-70 family)
MSQLEVQLLPELEKFIHFVRRRVSDPELAADIVQESLLKALKSAHQLRDEENITAWFYRILRHAIIDLHRRRATSRSAMDALERELEIEPGSEDSGVICQCVERLIPTLNPEYAELIRRLDLGAEPAELVGAALGLNANNLRVRHHRARRQLRERLEQTCRLCTKHGCLDCTCGG